MNQHGEIILYQSEDGLTKIDVRIEDETVWLTQQQMPELFQSSRSDIVEHIQHIYKEGELDGLQPVGNSDRSAPRGNWRKTKLFGNPEQLPPTARSCISLST